MLELPILENINHDITVWDNVMYTRKWNDASVLIRSYDGGETWESVYDFGETVFYYAIVTSSGKIVAITKTVSGAFNDPPADVWFSNDNGANFTKKFTLSSGSVASWSFDCRDETVYLSEYGKYDAPNIYKSVDGGNSWTTIFTHPRVPDGEMHVHAIHIDNNDKEKVYFSVGDSEEVQGCWYTIDGGANWVEYDVSRQPTRIATDDDYLYLFEDMFEDGISRVAKDDLFSGTFSIEKVYTASDSSEVDMANASAYASGIDNEGKIYCGFISYGEDHSLNNKDASIVVSPDQGKTWKVIKEYIRNADSSAGVSYISNVTDEGLMYVSTNNPNQIEILDTTREDLEALYTSTLGIRTS